MGLNPLLEASWEFYRKTLWRILPFSFGTVGIGYLLAEITSLALQSSFPRTPALRLGSAGFSLLVLGFSFFLLTTATSLLLTSSRESTSLSPKVILSFFLLHLLFLLRTYCLTFLLLSLPYGLISILLLSLWNLPLPQSPTSWHYLFFLSLTGANILMVGLLVSLSGVPVLGVTEERKTSAYPILQKSFSLVKSHWWRQLLVLILALLIPLILLWCLTFPLVLASELYHLRLGTTIILLWQTLIITLSAPFSSFLLTLSCLDLMKRTR